MTKFVLPREDIGGIETMQLGRDTADDIVKWLGTATIDQSASHAVGLQQVIRIHTPRGQLTAHSNDHIIKYGAMIAIVPDAAFEGLFVETDKEEIESMQRTQSRSALDDPALNPYPSDKAGFQQEPQTGVSNAVEEGKQPEGDQLQHQEGDGGGKASAAGSGDRHEDGGEAKAREE